MYEKEARMSDTHQVTCITKIDRPNPHERILFIGGTNADLSRWKLSQEDAIAGIESGKWRFYVSAVGHSVWVIVATSRFGNKYLKTEADGEQPDKMTYSANVEAPLA